MMTISPPLSLLVTVTSSKSRSARMEVSSLYDMFGLIVRGLYRWMSRWMSAWRHWIVLSQFRLDLGGSGLLLWKGHIF